MKAEIFLTMLSACATLDSLCVEAVKQIMGEKYFISYNLVALIMGLLIGSGSSVCYYLLNGLPFTLNNIIYCVFMGLATALSSTVGYDKVKQLIEQMRW